MSFLSGIFKAKPGGTFAGNLLRGVASKVTGGILGSGAMNQASLVKQAQKAGQIPSTAGEFLGISNQIQTSPDASNQQTQTNLLETAKQNIQDAVENKKPLLDLNDIVKLPTVDVETGLNKQTKTIAIIGIGILLFMSISRRR